jgi:hydrogenase maturation protease
VRYLVGIGNYTGGDDAVGLRVVEHIVASGLERDFIAVDLSSDALGLVAYLDADTEAVVIVDAARLGLAPGEYRFFSPDEVETRKETAGFSTHEGDVINVLALARSAGYTIPPLAIMGIEPQAVGCGLSLSDRLQERLPAYAAAAIERLSSL